MTVKKLSFQEAWDSSTIFFVDEELEDQIAAKVAKLIRLSQSTYISGVQERTLEDIIAFLQEDLNGLNVLLRDIGLSDEKFMRIVSLLRKIGHIQGRFDSEWSMAKIKQQLSNDEILINIIANLLFDGKHDDSLAEYIPRFYLNKLNYRELGAIPQALREIRYKDSTIGTYGGRKGYKVEARIASELKKIKEKHGIGYEQGRSRFINVDIDFAIPTLAYISHLNKKKKKLFLFSR